MLAAVQFYKAAGASSAHDPDDRIIYNTTSGALFYDPDGLGGEASVRFAVLGSASHPAITSGDFLIVA